MHVVLSHEQADFDSLGALLGAWLLERTARPVLPRRANRNLNSFVEVYSGELPFIEARALPAGPIERITLVDTQSMPTLKGVSSHTLVDVVDHHTLRPDLSPGWQVNIEAVGACTTLFVEKIQAARIPLNEIQSTLLLLGIYEDTGSLSYVSTTARDVHAAAWLLEQGASLQVAGEYLNPPLSSEQRRVFDLLLAAMETHDIKGNCILVACADAGEMQDEVSSIAHKLRDLLDPDALFLLVKTLEGIRMVARSTVDLVNVAEAAVHFGGGGHARASAALIHPEDGFSPLEALEQVHQELLEMLPQLVHSQVIVGQMMSPSPILLEPSRSASEASLLMKRYGYEGFPVISQGRVVGLLTRRAVDRSLGYKMNLPVGSLMNAGEVFVHPQDSLERLQEVMVSSGWGQVPVVDPSSDRVVGIVTRTDLFRSLGGNQAGLPGRQNLANQLENALPPQRLSLLKMIAAEAYNQHLPLYIVGGFVRDLFLERPSPDVDLVVEGDAIALAQALARRYGGRVVSHRRFGTAKWQIAEIRAALETTLEAGPGVSPDDLPPSLDMISARTEFYDYPTALPTVERSSIKLDLHRRDFSINTLALRLDGRHYGDLYDYWGGLNDLRQGIVRVLHSLSFVDDPTRMLRAVRFEQRFGFCMETRTLQLMEEASRLLKQVSGERLRHELDLILGEEQRYQMLDRLEELGLLSAIHPALHWRGSLKEGFANLLKGGDLAKWGLPKTYGNLPLRLGLYYLVWLGSLPPGVVQEIGVRLRFPHPLRSGLVELARLYLELPQLVGAPPSQIALRLEGVSPVVLYALNLLDLPAGANRMLYTYVTIWQHVRQQTDGNDLRARGLKPSPLYRSILEALRAAWLDGKVKDREGESQLLEILLEQSGKEEPSLGGEKDAAVP